MAELSAYTRLDDLSVEELQIYFKQDPQFFFEHRPSFVAHFFPEWVARYKPAWMVDAFPKYMLENHLDWVCFNKPTLALAFNFDYLLQKNPAWVVTHAQEYIAYSHPELLKSHDILGFEKFRTDGTQQPEASFLKKVRKFFGRKEVITRTNPYLPSRLQAPVEA
jgi:hypothetical protein